MRLVRLIAVVAWAGVALLAVAGFAAFSPDTSEPVAVEAAPSEPVAGADSARGQVSGLVAAQAFSQQQLAGPGSSGVEISETAELKVYDLLPPEDIPSDSPTAATLPPTTTTTTTTLPTTTTTTLPPTTTTTAAPTATTSTTIAEDGTTVATGSVGPCDASYYGDAFAGRTTASGEIFDPNALTAATHFVDFGTIVTVTRVDTGASVQVRVNDRGPYMPDLKTRHTTRCIDLSRAAMEAIGGISSGVVRVTLTMPADTNGLARLQARYGAL